MLKDNVEDVRQKAQEALNKIDPSAKLAKADGQVTTDEHPPSSNHNPLL